MVKLARNPDESRLCVVMLVANSFVHDTRVYKQARSLIEWGVDVHVIALRGADLPDEEVRDGIRVHRIPVASPRLRVLVKLPVHLLLPFPLILRAMLRADRPPASESRATAVVAATEGGVGPGRSTPAVRAVLQVRGASRVRRVLGKARTLVRRLGRKSRWWVRSIKGRTLSFTRRIRSRITPNATRLIELNEEMMRRAIELNPDVIECHDLNTLLAGFYVKKLSGVPLVYDSHELYLERNIGAANRRKDRLLWGFIERRCIGTCDAVLSVAKSICLHLERQYRIAPPHLIRNVQPFEATCDGGGVLSRELGIDPDVRLVIYPGAITINRGLEVLIDAAQHLNRAAVVIMGYARNAEYLDALRARAREKGVLGTRVFFRDAVPIQDVIRYVRSAEVGVVPTQNVCLSYYYESSNKIFHCLMAGVPVAMSDHPEKRMIVEEFGVGVLFDETDPVSIAAGINGLLDDRLRREAMKKACLVAARTLNWEHEEHRLRRIFAELLGPAAPEVPAVRLPDMAGEPSQQSALV